uniref:Uncharacterized protein n=1 Tax=Romanomermis culicivorax TaxID=13658 RepID=A0A915JVN0_ROMCU
GENKVSLDVTFKRTVALCSAGYLWEAPLSDLQCNKMSTKYKKVTGLPADTPGTKQDDSNPTQ